MKKMIMVLATLAIVVGSLQAQRIAFVDMQYILESMPEFEQAQAQVDQQAEVWRNEVDAKMKEVENAYKKFQAEQVLMTEEMKTNRINEIEALEKNAKEFQKGKFGPEGELFEKRQDLIKPIQDKIYDAIQLMAKDRSYDVILDKSSGVQVLFLDEKYDKSDEVIKALKN